MTIPTFFPASAPRAPLTFMAVDALVLHLLGERQGRELMLTQTVFSRDGEPMASGVSVYAVDVRQRRQWIDDPAAFDANWLGLAAGDGACAVSQIEAALNRVQAPGGLAA